MSGANALHVVGAVRRESRSDRSATPGSWRGIRAVRLAEQHRPGFAGGDEPRGRASRVRLSVLPGLPPNRPGKHAHPLALVRYGVAGAERRLLRIAEHRPHESALHVRPPGHADVRREVVPIGLVPLRAPRQLNELGSCRRRAHRAAGSCTCRRSRRRRRRKCRRRFHGHRRHDVVGRRERQLQVLAEAGVDRQGRASRATSPARTPRACRCVPSRVRGPSATYLLVSGSSAA